MPFPLLPRIRSIFAFHRVGITNIFGMFVLILVASCNSQTSLLDIKKGHVDITPQWDGRAISLEGDWIALPGVKTWKDLEAGNSNSYLIKVPSFGKNFSTDPNQKSTTIFLEVNLDSPHSIGKSLGLLTQKVKTAHKIIINGREIGNMGVASVISVNHEPRVKPLLSSFPYESNLKIAIQISNHTYNDQGLLIAPILGELDHVAEIMYNNKFYDIIFIIVVIFFILINLGIYISNPKEKSTLLFIYLLTVFALMIPFSSAGDRFIWDIFPNLSFDFVAFTEVLLIFLITPFYFLFLKYAFPQEMKNIYLKLYFVLKVPLVIFNLSDPYRMHNTVEYILVMDFIFAILSNLILIIAIANKRKSAKLLFAGFLIIIFTLLLDTLHEFGIINTDKHSLFGYFFMFILYSLALVVRVRGMYIENEKLNDYLKNANEFLEQRVENRTIALTESLKNLKDAVKLKDRFISIVSHDIRSPLSGIYSLVSFMNSDMDMDRSELSGNLKSIQRTLKNLIGMTGEILNYSKIQRDKIIPGYEIISLSEEIQESLERHQLLLHEKNISTIIRSDKDPFIIVDKTLLSIALSNLISNAIKFSKQDSTILIEYGEEDSHIYLRISDTGMGIPENRLDSLFYYDMNVSTLGTKGEKGTGFGLPFTKEVLDSMQIKLDVRSEIMVGTTIQLLFNKKEKICLVLDDNLETCDFYKSHMEKYYPDYFVIQKDTAELALEQLGVLHVDLILTDLNMPGMNGLDFAFRVRQLEGYQNTKILLITSYTDENDPHFREICEKGKAVGINQTTIESLFSEDLARLLES